MNYLQISFERKEQFNELKNFIRRIPSNEREEVKLLLKDKPVEYIYYIKAIVVEFETLSEAIKNEETQK